VQYEGRAAAGGEGHSEMIAKWQRGPGRGRASCLPCGSAWEGVAEATHDIRDAARTLRRDASARERFHILNDCS
jgi:hypothetical protein